MIPGILNCRRTSSTMSPAARVTARSESELKSQGRAPPSRSPMKTLVSETRIASMIFWPSWAWTRPTSVM